MQYVSHPPLDGETFGLNSSPLRHLLELIVSGQSSLCFLPFWADPCFSSCMYYNCWSLLNQTPWTSLKDRRWSWLLLLVLILVLVLTLPSIVTGTQKILSRCLLPVLQLQIYLSVSSISQQCPCIHLMLCIGRGSGGKLDWAWAQSQTSCFKSRLCHFLPVQSWTSHFSSLIPMNLTLTPSMDSSSLHRALCLDHQWPFTPQAFVYAVSHCLRCLSLLCIWSIPA